MRHGAQTDVGRYNKVLLPKKALADLQKIVSEARDAHYFITLPWDDNGYRVLPGAVYMEHREKMRCLSGRFQAAASHVYELFEELVDQARNRLGGLFRQEDYPTLDELRSKYSFETKILPLPEAGDFRVTLGDEEKAASSARSPWTLKHRSESVRGNSGTVCTKPSNTWLNAWRRTR